MMRPLSIKPVLNGFVVEVGCQTVVFNDVEELVNNLRNYYNNPENTEKKFREHPNAKHVLDGFAEPQRPQPTSSLTFTGPVSSYTTS